MKRTDTSIEGLELAYADALDRAKEAEAKARRYHSLLVDWRQHFRWHADETWRLSALIERTKEATQ